MYLKDYTPEQLADKIAAEGGVAAFFLEYDPEWEGTELETYVRDFEEAYLDLCSLLEEYEIIDSDEVTEDFSEE